MIKHFLFSIVILLLTITTTIAQPPINIDRAKILKTAEEKYGITPDNANITEAELISELMKKGVDFSNEKAVEEAALEIIRERQAKSEVKPNSTKKSNTNNSKKNSNLEDASIPSIGKEGGNDATQNQDILTTQPKTQIVENAQKKVPEKKPETKITKVVVEDKQVKLIASNPKVYGQDFPSSISLQVDPKSINPKSTYIVGSGDEFSVSIYGQRADDFKMVVNEDGYIGIPEVAGSRVYVKGLSYGKAKKLIL